MGLVSDSLPNLVQGVSQQPNNLRSVSQLEAQENCYSSPVEGLIQRPPTEHVAKVSTTPFGNAFIHTINRDVTQRFKAIFTSGLVKVFDLDGVEKTVNTLDETLQIHSAGVTGAGQVYFIAKAPGETALDFTTSGFGTATIKLQLSVDGAAWSDADTRTTNGTTVGVAIGSNLFMRANITAWTSGTIVASVTWKNMRYLNSTDPKYKIRALTVADYTFVVNTEKTVTMKPTLTPTRTNEGLVFCAAGEYGSAYSVYLDEVLRATFTTSTTVVTELSTTFIANKLYQALANVGDTSVTLLAAATDTTTGNDVELDYAAGETAVDFVVSGTFVGTIELEGSVDGVSGWTNLATRTTAGTTAGITTSPYLYVRARVSAYTSGSITGVVTYKWGGSYTFTLVGSSVWVQRTKPYQMRTEDAQGGTSLFTFKGTTEKFPNLPAEAPNGFHMAIDADPTTDQGKYFVKAEVTQAGVAFGPVSWIETTQQGVPYIIDPSTMPYVLIREVDGTFTFKTATWDDRLVGDEDSSLDPSFVGAEIHDITFYKNRLGFFADEDFSFSETGFYFNFWRTTITQIKDTDPVDSRASDVSVALLNRSVLFNKNLVLFSDQTQFEIPSETALTVKTVRCDVVSKFESLTDVAPLNTGKVINFLFSRDNFVGMKELFVSPSNGITYEADEVSAHVPAYIPEGAFSMSISTLEGVSAILTDGDPGSVYIYKTSWKNEKKTQSAWFRWNFDDYTAQGCTVLSADFIGSVMYLLIERNNEVFIERLRLLPNRVDDDATYVTFLDRRITDEDLVSAVYNVGTNLTTLTLPYNLTSTEPVVVTRSIADNTGLMDVGKQAQISQATVGTPTIIVQGNYSTNPLWIGQRFLAKADLSRIYVREQSGQVDPAGILQLLKGAAVYSDSAAFIVRVTPEGRSPSDYIFTGRIVGDINNVLGVVALRSGRFPFSILANNEHVTISILSNAFLPFKISSIEWEGNWTKRSQGR